MTNHLVIHWQPPHDISDVLLTISASFAKSADGQHHQLGFKKGTLVRLLPLKNFGQHNSTNMMRQIISQTNTIVLIVVSA